jgi:acetylornithine deacetylase/succinyl-diaminopimelate desuccinylase-like protein
MLVLALLACAPHVPPAPAAEVREAVARIDWPAAGDEAARVLSGYLQVDTRNPPGNESAGAEYLARILDAEGIPYETFEIEPGRASLIARIEGGDEPALCLLSHIDVATFEADRWTHGPLSGEIADGVIWGRGALDMKGLGVVELMTMVLLKRQAVPLDRDVVLLAVADEEMGNGGAIALAERWDRIGCSHVINEGGVGVKDAIFQGQTLYPISVAEKGWLWVKVVAHGHTGHGSTPRPGEAPTTLVHALERIESRQVRPEVQPAMRALLQAAGREKGGVVRVILGSAVLSRALVVPSLMNDPVTRATLTDTAHPTGFGGAEAPNVVPSEAWAVLDCRLLPGHSPDDLLAELKALVDDENVTFEVLEASGSIASAWTGDPLFEALERNLVDGRDGVVAAPYISIGSTDSTYLRPLGVVAYGIEPFEIVKADLAGMHGDDEHLAVSELTEGLRRFYGAVYDFAASPAP